MGQPGQGVMPELDAEPLPAAEVPRANDGAALQIQLDAQREIARHLRDAYPDELDDVRAAALVGAFVGAVTGALMVLLDDPDAVAGGPERLKERLRQATDVALRPWSG